MKNAPGNIVIAGVDIEASVSINSFFLPWGRGFILRSCSGVKERPLGALPIIIDGLAFNLALLRLLASTLYRDNFWPHHMLFLAANFYNLILGCCKSIKG